MHIHTTILKDLAKSFFGFFSFGNVNKIKQYHPLNERGMIRSLLYTVIIVFGWFFHLFGGNPEIIKEFCLMIDFGVGAIVSVGLAVLFMHVMLCVYAFIPFVTYIHSVIYAKKMFYVYWRLNKQVKFFTVNYALTNTREMKRTDIVRYFDMLSLYLFIKGSYDVYGMKGEISNKYRGIHLSHEIDKEARRLLCDLPVRFFNRNDLAYFFCLFYNTLNGFSFQYVVGNVITLEHAGNTKLRELLVNKQLVRRMYKETKKFAQNDIDSAGSQIRQYGLERATIISQTLSRDIYENII